MPYEFSSDSSPHASSRGLLMKTLIKTLFPRCVKCTKTEKSIGKGAHFDKLNNRSLVALFQALSETAGSLPRCIIKFHANGFERIKNRKLVLSTEIELITFHVNFANKRRTAFRQCPD
jgi:hypothetical protein